MRFEPKVGMKLQLNPHYEAFKNRNSVIIGVYTGFHGINFEVSVIGSLTARFTFLAYDVNKYFTKESIELAMKQVNFNNDIKNLLDENTK